MRKNRFLVIALIGLWLWPAGAIGQPRGPQKRPIIAEAMTISSSAVGFAAATLSKLQTAVLDAGYFDAVCVGTLETAAIRYTTEGTTPTSSVGHPLAVDQQLQVTGLASIQGWRGIRTTGSDGAIFWTCYV